MHTRRRTWRRLVSASVSLVMAVLLAACASAPAATRTTSSTPATIPTPNQPDPNATAVPDPGAWPEQDTPYDQASAQLQQAWAAYGVTIIPSRHVFAGMPLVPTVLNKTNGALTQAQVQQIGLAFYRAEALWGWAAAHDQMKLQLYLGNQGFLNTAAGAAESKGQPVQDPACELYPTKLAVVPVDASITSFLQHLGYAVSSPYALVESYKTPCSQKALTGAGAETVIAQWAFGLNLQIETGSSHDDPLLGLVYVGEAARDCPESGFPTAPPGVTFPPGALGPSPGTADGGPLACGVIGS